MLSGGSGAQSPPAITQLPTGGSVARGSATISQSATAQAAAMVVNQTSQRAVVNWDTFNVGAAASIHFAQPNAQAVTLNRVNDANPSQIYGRITAPGQVYLSNANGVYFSPSASVDVGGLVATTHRISDDNFMSGQAVFERNDSTAKVTNEGRLTATLGGYIALLAPEVQNAGVVVAQAGTVVLAAGEAITLNFSGNKTLASITTTAATIATLVENKLAVLAEDGQIILSAIAANKLQGGVVKNSGNLEASSLVNKGGKIVLEGNEIVLNRNSKIEAKGPAGGGTVLVGGDWQGSGEVRTATRVSMETGASIDASATDHGDGGKVVLWSDTKDNDSRTQVHGSITVQGGPQGGGGGQVETSGHQIDIAGATVNASASQGNAGQWLIDPYDYTIGTSEASAIATALGAASVTVTTANDVTGYGSNGSSASSGDITVNSAITWSANNKLTLSAARNININAAITANGTTSAAGVALLYNQGNVSGDYNFGLTASGSGSNLAASFAGSINFANTAASFSTQNYSAASKTFTLINSVSTSASIYCATLATCDTSNTTNYALANNIDASTFVNGAAKYNNLRGTSTSGYNATFTGLGHTISKLSLGTSGTSNVGLFYTSNTAAVVRDLRLSGVSLAGGSYTGSLIGNAAAGLTINNVVLDSVNATSSITSSGNYVGGLVGNTGNGTNNLTNTYVLNTNVSGSTYVGGVVGLSYMTATNVHKTGNVTGTSGVTGGVFGFTSSALNNVDSVGDVSGSYSVGGLIGDAGTSTLTNAFALGSVSGNAYQVGGLIGNYGGGTLTNTSAGGAAKTVSGTYNVGGLIGRSSSNVTFSNASFTGTSITASNVTATESNVGGMVGYVSGTANVSNSNMTGAAVTGVGNYAGGLVGFASTAVNIANSYAKTTTISGAGFVGGLAGNMGSSGGVNGGSMLNSYFEGSITLTGTNKINYGGLAGYMVPGSWLSNSYYNIDTSTIDGNKVVTPGGLFNAQYTAWSAPGVSPASRVPLTNIGSYLTLDATDNSYVIDTTQRPADLINLLAFVESATQVNAGVTSSIANGYTFKLGANLDMSAPSIPYIPYFGATEFKGNTYSVNNFSFNRPTSSVGFLGVVQNSTLTDLKVNSVAYAGQTTNTVNARDYVGTAIGSLYGGTLAGATATLSAKVNALNFTGGLAGYVGQSVMYNVSAVLAPTTSASVTGLNKTGGLVGWMDAVAASTLSSNLPVSGTTQVGGLVGYLKSDFTTTNANVTSNSATGLTASGNVVAAGTGSGATNVGGLIGEVTGTSTAGIYTLANASATGTVSSSGSYTHYMGGLIGSVSGGAAYNNLQSSGAVTQTTDAYGYGYVGGLIGNATATTTISNSSSSSPVSSWGYYTGGLIGYAAYTTLINSSATGTVTSSSNNVGGLVGQGTGGTNYTAVSATGTVSGTYYVGGLVGYAGVNITNAYASGNVTGTALNSSYTGGLIGYLAANTLLDSKYITGTVTGTNAVGGVVGGSASNSFIKGVFTAQPVSGSQDYVGGLVGKLGGTLTTSSNATPLTNGVLNPYSSSAVTGRYDVGGLVGRADTTAVISNAYFTGSVTANVNYGGIVGYLTPGAQVTNAHYNIDAVSLTGFTPASPAARVPVIGLVTLGGLFNDQNQYTNWLNPNAISGVPALDGLTLVANNAAATFNSVAIDGNGFYSLSSTQDLRNYLGFADQTSLKFKLGNTIDMTGAAGLYIPYISGSFDPNGKSITNLNLSQFTSSLGFIGHLQGSVNTQVVAGLTVTDATVLGKTNVGLAVGSAYRRGLTTPYTTGSVTGTDVVYAVDPSDNSVAGKSNVGGVVGYAIGASSATAVLTGAALGTSATTATVSGGSDVGGLIGRLWLGTVTNVTSTGTVTGTSSSTSTSNYTGGLIGFADASTVINNVSHTTGLVSGVNYVGGLIGQSAGAIGATGTTTTASSKVEASVNYVGGLIGATNGGTVTNATASGNISGPSDTSVSSYVGGLIGQAASSAISASSYTGTSIKAAGYVGGLVGNSSTTITNSTVNASTTLLATGGNVGGLVGYSSGAISNSSSSANVSGAGSNVGGLVGNNNNTITGSTATNALTGSYIDASGNTIAFGVKGGSQVGGLVGISNYNSGSAITNSTANTTVIGLGADTGGFIGQLWYGTITGSGAAGTVYGINETGGFVGQIYNTSVINTSYATANVINTANTTSPPNPATNTASSKTGGFVGSFNVYTGSITSSRASGSVKGSYNVGGFVGYLTNTSVGTGSITNSYATGMVTGTGDSAGGFAGYADLNFTGTLSNFYAMGAVKGNTNVGGLVGYADRGTFNYGFSTGYVTSSSNATSIGGSFGGLNSAIFTAPSTYRVVRNNLYFDTTTSNRSTDIAGGGGTGAATGLTTTALQGALPHANFATATWGTGTGLYPYLKVFYPTAPQAISGIATLSNGGLAARAQFSLYSGGLLLNGGTASTGVNGYYYELVGAGALRSDAALTITANTKLGATLTLDGQTTVAGMVYSDAQTLTNNNVSLVDGSTLVGLKMGLTRERTGAATGTLLNTDLDATFGATNRAAFSTSLPTRSSLELTATAASFDLDTALSYSDGGVSNAGSITVTGAGSNTNITLSGGTITSSKTQSYNAALTLGANETLTGTSITTSSTLAGAGKNLNIVGTASAGSGNFNTGGIVTNVAQLSVAGTATFGANVTTSGTQTYSGDVLMKTAATTLSSVTAPGTGANITISGNLGGAQTAHGVSVQTGTGTFTVNGAVGTGTGITAFNASGANLALQEVDATQSVTLSPGVAGTVGAISGSSTALTMAGAGTLTLTTNNSYGGTTTVSAGSLQLGAGGQLGSGTYNADIAIASGAQLQFSSALNQTLTGMISGSGGLRKDTSGVSTLTLAGNNSYSGTTTISAGSVLTTQPNALGATSGATVVQAGGTLDVSGQSLGAEPITLSGGTLSAATADGSVSGAVTLSANSALNAASTKELSVSGVISSGSNGLVLTGTGNFQLNNAANAITTLASDAGIGSLSARNSTALSVGSVTVGGNTYSGLSSTGDIVLRNNAALSLDAGITSSAGAIDLVASRVLNNAGSTALQTSAGKNWRVWSTNTTPFDTSAHGGDVDADLPADYIQYNASYGSSAVQGTGNGMLYTLAPQISASLTGTITKTYDGSDHVSVAASNYSITGLIHGDQLSAVLPNQSVFTDAGTGSSIAGVGSGKTVVVSGMSLLGTNAGKTVYGYQLSTPNVQGTGGEVVPAPLLLTMAKTYDASSQFDPLLGYTLTGMVNNESAPSITSGSANTASPNAATYTSFVSSSFALNNPNYTLPLNNVSATIRKAPIGIEMTANYSGSTTVTPLSVNVFGLVNGETIVPTRVVLNDKNVSANGSNYVTALLAGTGTALASNYTFVPTYNATPNTGTTNTITLSPTNLTVTAAAVTQTYNGLSYSGGGGVTLSGLLGTDTGASLGGTLSYAGNSQGARHVGGYTLTPGGLSSSNYNLSFVDGTLSITPKTVSLSASKTYDGTTTLSGPQVSISTGVGTEVLSYSNAQTSDAHVASTSKFIQTITLANGTASAGTTAGLASDYQLPALLNAVSAPVTINAATLTPTLSNTNVSKVYDSTTAAPASFSPTYTFTGLVDGDSAASLSQTGMAYNSSHVRTANSLTVSGLSIQSITGSNNSLASDYVLDTSSKSVAASITPQTVTLSASKTYDGSTTLSGPQVSISTGVGSEVLNYTNAQANDAHVASANKFIQAITLADGTASAGVTAGLASDYQLPTLNPSNAPVSISAATLTPTLSNLNVNKDYDGTTAAPSGFTASYTFSGLVAGDTSAVLTPTNSIYNDAHVLGANTLTLSGLSIGGVTGTNHSLPSDYVLSASTQTVAATISPKAVALSANKTYDGTTTLNGSQVVVTTGVAGEDLSYSAATASDAHVATPSKFVQAITLGNGTSGLVSDYKLPTLDAAHAPVSIQPATLTTSLTNTNVSKVYDGTLDGPAGFVPTYSVTGFVLGDSGASLSHDNVTYNNANVVGASSVTVSGLKVNTIAGNKNSAATDYVLDASSKDVSASITVKDLRVTANNDSVFFADTDTPGYKGVSYVGLVNGQTAASLNFAPTITNSVSTADHSNPGVYVGALTPSGISSTNYRVIYQAGNFTVLGADNLLVKASNITTDYGSTPSFTIESAAYKYTDANSVVRTVPLTVTSTGGNSFRVEDSLGGYATFSLVPDVGAFTTASGNAKVGAYNLVVNGLNNHARFQNTVNVTGTETVVPKALTVTSTGNNKTYNGNTTASVNLATDKIGTDDVTAINTSANFADKNVGTHKVVSVSGISITGNDAVNYSLLNTTDTTHADISPASLTVSASGINKVYDGTVNANVTLSSNQIAGDLLVLSKSSANFANKMVANGKAISVGGIAISGVDAGNYDLQNTSASTSADITRKALSVSGITAANKVYDGNANATVSTSGVTAAVLQSGGMVAGDDITVSTTGNFRNSGNTANDKTVGDAKTVLLSSTYGGHDVGNYSITDQTTTSANITPRALSISSIAASSSIYGAALVPGAVSFNNVVSGDVVNASASVNTTTRSSSNNPIAGTYTQTASTSLTGSDAGNYSFAGYTTPSSNYTIQKLTLAASGIAAANSTYGSVLTPGAVSLTQVIAGDAVTASASVNTSTLSSSGQAVVGSYTQSTRATLSGTDAGNYSLPMFTSASNYTIAPLTLSASIANGQSTYGSALAPGAVTFSNARPGDIVSASNLATVDTLALSSSGNPVVGSYTQTVAAGLSGTDAANYSFTGRTSATANYSIQRLALVGSLSAGRSVYGSPLQLGTVSFGNVLNSDDVNPDMVDINTTGRLSSSGNLKAGTYTNAQFVGTALNGSDANNYTFAGARSDYVVEQQALAISGITASSKVYDGTATATVSIAHVTDAALQVAGLVAGDVLTLSSTGVFRNAADTASDKNAGVSKPVALTNVYGGADLGNYNIIDQTRTTADITPKQVQLSATKTYDGSTALSGNQLTIATGVGSEKLNYSAATIGSKNVADNATNTVTSVTLTDGANGGLASNYTYTTQRGADNAVSISRANLNLAAVSDSKTYDGSILSTQAVAVTNASGSTDVVSAVQEFTSKNALGTNASTLQVKNNYTVVDVHNVDMQDNYTITANSTALGTITPKALSATVSATDKAYNGNEAATATLTIASGLVGTETVGVAGSASFSDKNAGRGKTVTVDSVTLSNGNNGGLASNYSLLAGETTTATITPKALTASVTAADKIYNGDANATATLAITSGLVGSETLGISGVATFSDKNVRNGKTVTVNSVTLANGNNGGLASNYSLVAGESTTASITPRALTISGISASNKVYDGSANASVSTSGVTATVLQTGGMVAGDQITVTSTGTFRNTANTADDKNVGTAKTVALTNTYGGIDLGNYTLTDQSTTTASITPKALTISGISASNKVYDGSANASVSTSGVTATVLQTGGMVAGDQITVTSTGTFRNTANTADDKNVGTAKTVALTNTYGGIDLGNYTLTDQSTTTASITPKALTISGISASGSTYGATLAAGSVGFSNVVGQDVVTANARVDTSALSTSGNPVVGIYTQTAGTALSGSDAGNYSFAGYTTPSANYTISPRALTLSGISAVNKVYDGSVTAILSGTPTVASVSGDVVTVNSAGMSTFADKNVGVQKTVTPATFVLAGTDASNYSLQQPSSLSANITRLSSVVWTGGTTGNWLDPANWAGGAVPDLSNVASVVIPATAHVVFNTTAVAPAQAGTVYVDSVVAAGLAAPGSLNMVSGDLVVGAGGLALSGLTQTGGSLSTSGNLSVTQSFRQGSQGTVNVAGNATLTNASGPMVLGALTVTGNLEATNNDGSITQASASHVEVTGNSSFVARQGADTADVLLASTDNQFSGWVSITGHRAVISAAQALRLGAVATDANLEVTSTGELDLGTSTVKGNLLASSGSNITQSGPLVVAGTTKLDAGTGSITLSNPNNRMTGALTNVGRVGVISGAPMTTAPFVPVMPAPEVTRSATVTQPPAEVLPIVVPTSNAAAAMPTPDASVASASAGVVVNTIRAASQQLIGIVAVLLPKGSSNFGSGLVIALPAETFDTASTNNLSVRATQPNGAPLPSWIKYVESEKGLVLGAVPEGGLPFQVLLTVGMNRTVVQISESQFAK